MPTDERPKTFVLGLGAQKAATSWVHRYLRHYPEADFGAIKEYHVWDVLRVPHFSHSSPLTPRTRIRSIGKRLLGRDVVPDRLRRRFCADTETYFDYFAGLLAPENIRLTGDITPSYSALPPETLAEIRDGFAARGIAAKAVFLMRDPVERCHSVVRMHKRDRKSRESVDIRLADDEALRRYATSPDAQLRTRYDRTLAAIDAAFPPEDVFTGFYETIFTEPEVRRLSAFFGVEPELGFVETKVNVSFKTRALAPETEAFLRAEFAPVYAACAERFPITREIWQAA